MKKIKGRLEKLEVKGDSPVGKGAVIDGTIYIVRNFPKDPYKVVPEQLTQLRDDDMIMVQNEEIIWDFLKTSPIKKIIQLGKYNVKFETDTSVYKIELLEEIDDGSNNDSSSNPPAIQ